MELQIGKVAKQFGLSVNAVRKYEEKGLIGPLRRRETGYASRGYRIFTDQDIARLAFLRQARLLDLSLGQIKELLESVDQGCCSSARPNLIQLLEAKLREVDEKMEGLRGFRRQLQMWLKQGRERLPESEPASSCLPGSTPSQCVFGDSQPLESKKEVKGIGRG